MLNKLKIAVMSVALMGVTALPSLASGANYVAGSGQYDSSLYQQLPGVTDGFVHGLVGDYGPIFIGISLAMTGLYVVKKWVKSAFH